MDATSSYKPETIREYLAAWNALEAATQGQDCTAERDRLSAAEDRLMAEGWQNNETREQLELLLDTAAGPK